MYMQSKHIHYHIGMHVSIFSCISSQVSCRRLGVSTGRGLRLVHRYRFLFHRFKPECHSVQTQQHNVDMEDMALELVWVFDHRKLTQWTYWCVPIFHKALGNLRAPLHCFETELGTHPEVITMAQFFCIEMPWLLSCLWLWAVFLSFRFLWWAVPCHEALPNSDLDCRFSHFLDLVWQWYFSRMSSALCVCKAVTCWKGHF